jgi:hypothetical protein
LGWVVCAVCLGGGVCPAVVVLMEVNRLWRTDVGLTPRTAIVCMDATGYANTLVDKRGGPDPGGNSGVSRSPHAKRE